VATQAGWESTDASMQTAAAVTVDCAMQVAPAQTTVETQVERLCHEVDVQTSVETREAALQAGSTSSEAASVQTEVQNSSVAVQAEVEATIAVPASTCESSMQASADLTDAGAQTILPTHAHCGTQVERRKVEHRSVQVEDTAARDEKHQCESRIKDLEESLQRTEEKVKGLGVSKSESFEEIRKCREDSQAWQQMAQSKAMGQMNITILCPRAECTVNGSKVEMDSWNPTKLRRDFETEVLPRFSKLFIEEGPAHASGARPEAVQRTMEEFANVFRERLSAMLSAPNANAAVTAASAKGAVAA